MDTQKAVDLAAYVVAGPMGLLMAEVGGSLFTGNRQTAAGLNRQRWAKITGSDSSSTPTRYSWDEYTAQGQTLVALDAGMHGTTTLNPIIDPNGATLNVGTFIKVRQAYFDPQYDWVFYTEEGGGGGGSLTVENEDDSQQVDGVTTLILAKKRRYTVTSPAVGQAKVELDMFWAEIISATSTSKVTLTSSAPAGAISLKTDPLPVSLHSGDTLDFSNAGMIDPVTATLSADAATGAKLVSVQATGGVINNQSSANVPAQAYGWREMTETVGGKYTVLGGGRSGTPALNPAYEANRSTNVPNGAIVRMWRGAGLGVTQEYQFMFTSDSSSSSTTTVTNPPTSNPLATSFLAMIDDYEPNTHGYTWHEVLPSGAPEGGRGNLKTVAMFTTKTGGKSGTALFNPAYETNDNPRTPNETVVMMYKAVENPATGSGLTVQQVASVPPSGALNSVGIVNPGSGYPVNASFFLVVEGGNHDCVISVTTDGTGKGSSVVVAGFDPVNNSNGMGTGYSAGVTYITSSLGLQYNFMGDTTPFWAKITGYNSSNKAYAWSEEDATNAGNLFYRPTGRYGTSSPVTSQGAYEVSQNANVQTGTHVLLYWGYYSPTDQQELLFSYPALTFTIASTDQGAGDPANASQTATKIDFKQVDGFTYASINASEVKVGLRAASVNHSGTVNLLPQVFGAGDKAVGASFTVNSQFYVSFAGLSPATWHLLLQAYVDANHAEICGPSPAGANVASTPVLLFEYDTSGNNPTIMATSNNAGNLCAFGIGAPSTGISRGIFQTVSLAKLTAGGANGSLTIKGGIATGYVAPT